MLFNRTNETRPKLDDDAAELTVIAMETAPKGRHVLAHTAHVVLCEKEKNCCRRGGIIDAPIVRIQGRCAAEKIIKISISPDGRKRWRENSP
jgi:hypothetical protein